MNAADEMVECIHGIWPDSCCTVCNGKPAPWDDDRPVFSFPARYVSRLDCGHLPEVGDTIFRTAGERLICSECVS